MNKIHIMKIQINSLAVDPTAILEHRVYTSSIKIILENGLLNGNYELN